MWQGLWKNGDYKVHQKGGSQTQLQPSVNLWKMDSTVMEFLFFSKRNKSLYFHMKSPTCHWDWSCLLHSSESLHISALPIAPSKCIPLKHKPQGYLTHSCHPSSYSPHLLKTNICPWPSVCLATILMQHFGKSNTDLDGPSNTLVPHFLCSLKFHDIFSTPPQSPTFMVIPYTLSMLLPSISYILLSGHHFLFSSLFPLIIKLQFFRVVRATNPLIHVFSYKLRYNDPSS